MAISEEVLAKTVHGAIVAFCQAIGDNSIKPWEEAESWQRQDSIRVVRFHRERGDERGDGVRLCFWFLGGIKKPKTKSDPLHGSPLHSDRIATFPLRVLEFLTRR